MQMIRKISFTTLSLFFLAIQPASAQLGGLLGKGKSAGKKSGNFSTVWESEFDNKATRLALALNGGEYIIGTDDNSATVLDANGKIVWSGDYKKNNY